MTSNIFGFGEELDDAELIKSYENAVKTWNKPSPTRNENATEETSGIGPWVSVSVTAPNGGESQTIDLSKHDQNMLSIGNWIIGSPCRGVYSEDGLEYEAKVVGIEGPRCTIRFVGYGNVEKKHLVDLKDTFGKRSRDRQRREAQQSNIASGELLDAENEYYSSVSLTSSMYNNCNDSIVKEREDDKLTTSTTECSGHPRSSKFSKSAIPKGQLLLCKRNNLRGGDKKMQHRAGEEMSVTTTDDALALDNEGTSERDPLDRTEEIVPSAEATIFSSTDSSSLGEESDDEADGETSAAPHAGPTSSGGGGGHLYEAAMKTFPNSILRLPIPPMPMSLAGPDGKIDYGRGQIPALLLSWYMSGYHAGYYDAQNEIPTTSSASKKTTNATGSPNRTTKEDKTSGRNHKRV